MHHLEIENLLSNHVPRYAIRADAPAGRFSDPDIQHVVLARNQHEAGYCHLHESRRTHAIAGRTAYKNSRQRQ